MINNNADYEDCISLYLDITQRLPFDITLNKSFLNL